MSQADVEAVAARSWLFSTVDALVSLHLGRMDS